MSQRFDPTYGVKSFTIAGRMIYERERAKGMTDVERQWRAQWLKDQELSLGEPRNVPEYYKATTNIFRRIYKTPLYAIQSMLEPSLGYQNAYFVRHTIGKCLLTLYAGWACYAYYRFYANDWTHLKSVEINIERGVVYPDDPNYPNYEKIEDYYDQGFSSSPLSRRK